MPRGLSSNWARCSGVAANNRGNHARGTSMIRPSSKWTHMLSSSNRTALAEVVMPSPFDQLSVGLCHLHRLAQRPGVKAVAGGDSNLWFEPEFGLIAAGPHVHVHRLARAALVGLEEEAEALVAKRHRHRGIVGRARATVPESPP